MLIPPSTLSQPTWRSQWRAMWAVARRDWRQYWRYPLNAVSTIMQPVIWLAPVYFMGLAFSQDGEAIGFAGYSGTTDYVSFVLIGAALSSFIGAVFWGMGFALKEEMDMGVLEINWLAPIPRLILLVGHTFTNLAITTINSISILAIAALLFGFDVTDDVLAAFLTVLPMLIGLYGFGFAFAALVLVMREANTMVDISNFLVQTFSGAQFPVNSLPRFLLPIALAIPLTYGFDAVRGFLLDTTTLLPIWIEIVLLLVFMVVMVVVGVRAFFALERSVRRRGTLGQH